MNASISQSPGCCAPPSGEIIRSLPSGMSTGKDADFASAPEERHQVGALATVEAGSASDRSLRNLLDACLRMLKLTGGSHYWTGDTQAALEFMEAAVEEILAAEVLRRPQNGASLELGDVSHAPEESASHRPRPTASAIVPEIIAAAPSAIQCGLQMAGVELERQRS